MKLVVIFDDELELDIHDFPFLVDILQKIAESDIVKEVILYDS